MYLEVSAGATGKMETHEGSIAVGTRARSRVRALGQLHVRASSYDSDWVSGRCCVDLLKKKTSTSTKPTQTKHSIS